MAAPLQDISTFITCIDYWQHLSKLVTLPAATTFLSSPMIDTREELILGALEFCLHSNWSSAASRECILMMATFRGGEELVVSGPVSLPIGNLTEWVPFTFYRPGPNILLSRYDIQEKRRRRESFVWLHLAHFCDHVCVITFDHIFVIIFDHIFVIIFEWYGHAMIPWAFDLTFCYLGRWTNVGS